MDYFEQICNTFLKNFAESVKLNDQLPVNMAGYNVLREELQGEVITWCHQYLCDKNCPVPLLTPIIEIVKCKVEKLVKSDASSLGYDEKLCYFNPLKLMQRVISELNEVCLDLQNNEKLIELLNTIPSTTAYPIFAVSAVKNTRKKMEDRHICLNDFNRLYSLHDKQPMSFYGVFDGHGGTTAACYCVANFHNFLSQNCKLSKRTDEALRETFLKTDKHYAEKSVQQCFTAGSCALCAVYKIKEKKLFVGWLGDSQALLVKKGRLWQIVQKHSPSLESERNRIEQLGGVVLNYGGTWRVQGQLAVARAIGPATYKPFISNEPDICCIELDGEEDFLILGCDGLWDNLSEDEVAITVYRQIKADPDNLQLVTQKLVEVAKAAGSSDNITVIVIFLKNPTEIVDLTDCIQELKNANNLENDTTNILSNNTTTTDAPVENNAFSLENRILGELQLRNPDMVFAVSDNELSVNSEKKDLEKDAASGFSADANLVVGDSGCEDSEDEWDFIKIDKESEKKPSNITENQNKETKMSSEILNNQISDTIGEIKSDMQSQPLSEAFNEKDLVYNIENTEKNDDECHENSAESKLNPGAKEFIPRSPASPVQNTMLLFDDAVVAQSPKPSNNTEATLMENINVPSEREFDAEISNRPHETEDTNDFIVGENLNPKEAAQSDEKLEEDYIAISNGVNSTEQNGTNLITFDRFNEPDAMNESFYEENRCDELNKIQTLPVMAHDQDPLNEGHDNDKENCLIKENEEMINFDNINQILVDPSQSVPLVEQPMEVKEEIQLRHEEKHEDLMNMEQISQKLDPVPDLLNSDPDMNKIVEQPVEQNTEELINFEASNEVPTPAIDEIVEQKNEMNQIVTEEKAPETENLLIITGTDEVTVVKDVGEKCEKIETLETEKVSDVLIESIPDVIPKPVEKSSVAPVEKQKAPATKTVTKRAVGTKPSTGVVDKNGVKGVASKTSTGKATEVKKTVGATKTAPASTTRPPISTRTTTTRPAGVTAARTVTSSTTRTTTTTASRVGARPAPKTTTTTTAKTQEAPKPIRKPLSSTTTKPAEARVPISQRSAPKTTSVTDGKPTQPSTATSRVGSAKPKVTSTTTTTTKRPLSAPKTSVEAKVSSTRATAVSKSSSVPNRKPTTATTKKIDPKAVPSKNIIKKPAVTPSEAPAETKNGVAGETIESATNN